MDLITINQKVFEVYLGLAVSGYDLGNPIRTAAMYKKIRALNWNPLALKYFSYAYINDGRINPYWPRASILTLVSILVDLEASNLNKTMVKTHLAALDNVSPKDIDDDVVNWASTLNEQIVLLRATQGYTDIWACYQQIAQDEILRKGNQYTTKILSAQDRLFDLLPLRPSPIKITTLLNPLQADPLTDIMSIHDSHYVVTSHLRASSFIHELIHVSINPYLHAWKDKLSQSKQLLDSVYDHMKYLSYAWDHSFASWQNVFSETLVRVLTVFVSENKNRKAQETQIADLVQQGFLYAPPIARTITITKKIHQLSDEWLEDCLNSCTAIAE